jgi:hypothetical protein
MRGRFNDYHAFRAKRAGAATCKEGHAVTKGDGCGWNPRTKDVCCAACWATWTAENEEADRLERADSW